MHCQVRLDQVHVTLDELNPKQIICWHDETQPNKNIIYTECNSLYGKAMTEPLLTGLSSWVDDINSFKVEKIHSHDEKTALS